MKEENEGKKSIDPGDLVSACIDVVKKLFEGKEIYLSDRAYTSLFLGIWSLILIRTFSQKSFYDWITYLSAYGLIIYFLLHLFMNWSWAQNLFMKILNRPAYDIKLIKEDRVEHTKVALIIKRLAINNPQEVIKQIKELIKKGRFKEDIQIALISQYNKYPIELANYIEGLILSEKKTTLKTVGLFLIVSARNLSDGFLDDLYKTHHESKSFLFNLGRSHIYTKIEGDLEKKYYNAGYQFKNFRRLTQYGTIFAAVFLGIVFLGSFLYGIGKFITPFYFLGALYMVALSYLMVIFLIGKTRNLLDKKKVKTLLKNEQIELSEVDFDKFVNELNL